MLRPSQNILPREIPMSPPEISDLIQTLQIPCRTLRILQGVFPHAEALGSRLHPRKEFPVVARPVLAEVAQDLCEWSAGHGYLQEVVAEWDHRIVGA